MQGTIIWLGETVTVSPKFKKREFVVETDEKYPQKILFQVSNDKCEHMNNYQVGDYVELEYNLRGRDWKGKDGVVKYFNTLECWRIANFAKEGHLKKEKEAPSGNSSASEEKDLPF